MKTLVEQGTKAEGDTTMIDVQVFSEAFLNVSPRSACFTDVAFFIVKSKTLVLGLFSSGAGLPGFSDYWTSD